MSETNSQNFCYLRDQIPISQAAFNRSRAIREQIRDAIAVRASYVDQRGGDPSIHLPGANWETGSDNPLFQGLFQTVMDGDYATINSLRVFSFSYTGFQLLTQKHTPEIADQHTVLARGVPADADEQLARLATDPQGRGQGFIQMYLDFIRHLPELLHITPPRMFGEIGWVVDGKIVNHDTVAYLERLTLLCLSGALWELRRSARSPESRGWSDLLHILNDAAKGRGLVPSLKALGSKLEEIYSLHQRPSSSAQSVQPERPRILEIGSGYGGLAYYLKTLIPDARYVCVDLPESLLFSSIYLSTLFPDEDNAVVTPNNAADLVRNTAGFTFVPNYMFDALCDSGQKFDLIINTLSMSEMLEKQVRYYGERIPRLLGARGVFFEQNQDNKGVGLINAREILAEYLPHCLPLSCPFHRLTQGFPHLWAAAPVHPYQWENSL